MVRAIFAAMRAGLARMLGYAARRKFDTILIWEVSRLARSLRDLADIFETLRARKIDLVIHQSGIDMQTPTGIAMIQTSGVFAQFARAMIVERTKAGMARARAHRSGLAPLVAALSLASTPFGRLAFRWTASRVT